MKPRRPGPAGGTAAAVTLRYEGNDYTGSVEFTAPQYGQPAELLFRVSFGTPLYAVYDRLADRRNKVPAPNAWYRDAWYYLEQHGLENQFYFSFESSDMATREQFCRALFHAAEPLAAINEMNGLPDFSDSDILALYQAGVLTGRDGGDGFYYLDSGLRPAIWKFDLAGPIGADRRGFVGLDGKIYRIEF